MSDLISRSELIEEIKSLSIILNGKQIFSDDAKDTVLRIIKEQPTAYDIDKVVEELYEKRTEILLSNDYECEIINYCLDNFDKAIEIVKEGGKNEWFIYWSEIAGY